MSQLLTTPLHAWHVAHGAKMAPFAGYDMPIRYGSLIEEHLCVRQKVGLFDVSHMGQFYVSGPNSLVYLQQVLSNHVAKLEVGDSQYALLLNEHGYALDDLIVSRIEEQKYLLVVNASNRLKDFSWMQKHLRDGVSLIDQSENTGMIALQGPASIKLLNYLNIPWSERLRFKTRALEMAGSSVLISGTGYTGEVGVEVLCQTGETLDIWENLLKAGQDLGIQAIGLGARDTLRLEKGYALYGHELSEEISPLEAGLSWVIDFKKEAFIGKEALLSQRALGLKRRVKALKLLEAGVPREGMELKKAGGQVLGKVLSGTQSPSLQCGIASVLVDLEALEGVGEVFVDIRGKLKKASLASFPLI
ncbi:MAG: glycine cleavage system aminomethyltransferase GcvT [Deltaproteobacteria bacterium]|nr:glycine cleavage system aminomethyltransferase GcvT [Deltaproteobacteria bacterium]